MQSSESVLELSAVLLAGQARYTAGGSWGSVLVITISLGSLVTRVQGHYLPKRGLTHPPSRPLDLDDVAEPFDGSEEDDASDGDGDGVSSHALSRGLCPAAAGD